MFGSDAAAVTPHLLVSFGPVRAVDVPQVAPVLDLIMSNLLVFQPHDAVPEL